MSGTALSRVVSEDLSGWGDRQLNGWIKRGHVTAGKHMSGYEQAAAVTGLLLIEKKRRLSHGKWLPWVERHFDGDRTTAFRYMQMAEEMALSNVAAAQHLEPVSEPPQPVVTDGFELRYGDARDVLADVPDESVHLVLTDPPYGDEAEPLYEWLAEWSARVLMPGGSLVCFTGQSRLDRDMRIFGEHLRYWWTMAMLHTQSQQLPGKFVRAGFKPVLWFVKERREGRTMVDDVLRPPKPDKSEHKWGQAEGGVTFLIEQLTAPGERILDPFAGTATWGRIAESMGRRWLGAEAVADPDERGKGVVLAA